MRANPTHMRIPHYQASAESDRENHKIKSCANLRISFTHQNFQQQKNQQEPQGASALSPWSLRHGKPVWPKFGHLGFLLVALEK